MIQKRLVKLVLLTILSLVCLEIFTYPGFLINKFRFSIYIPVVIACWLVAIGRPFLIINKFIKWIIALITASALVLNTMEYYYFPNYVFSHFRLNLEAINILIGLFITIVFSSVFKAKNKLFLFCLTLLLYTSAALTIQTTSNSIGKAAYVLTHLKASEYDKLLLLWGNVINYFDFINTEVLPDQTIVVPSGRIPFKYTSSGLFVSYFVYPRRVLDTKSSQINFGDWAILTSEEIDDKINKSTWPDFPTYASMILIYKGDSNRKELLLGNYSPDMFTGNKPWGLIKLSNTCHY